MKTILKGGTRCTINGVTYQGHTIVVDRQQVIVDGQPMELAAARVLDIHIDGDVERIETEAGCVTVAGVTGHVSTVSGNIACDRVGGNVSTVSGHVECVQVHGSVNTVSGDIKNRRAKG